MTDTEHVAEAVRSGAKIVEQSDGLWAILDMPKGSPLWFAVFRSETDAAKAFNAALWHVDMAMTNPNNDKIIDLANENTQLRATLAEVFRRNTFMRDHLTGRIRGDAAHHFFGPLDTTQDIIRKALGDSGER